MSSLCVLTQHSSGSNLQVIILLGDASLETCSLFCRWTYSHLHWSLDTFSDAHADARDTEKLLLKLPTNFQEAQAVKATLMLYKETCRGLIVALLISLYLFLQVCPLLAIYLTINAQIRRPWLPKAAMMHMARSTCAVCPLPPSVETQ